MQLTADYCHPERRQGEGETGAAPRPREAGIENPSIEVSTSKAKGRVRVTCRREIAQFIAEEFDRAIATAVVSITRDALRQRRDAMLAAIDKADAPPPPA